MRLSIKYGFCTGMLLIFLSARTSLSGQEDQTDIFRKMKELAESGYGPDQGLVNGQKYNYPYRSARGTIFLELEGNDRSTVWIDGRAYRDQYVRYDLYGQHMVLEYKDISGAPSSIILPGEWLERVVMGSRVFKKYNLPDGSVRFGEIIHDGPVECMYFWDKDYRVNLDGGQQSHYFTEPELTKMIRAGDSFISFRGTRSFLKALPETVRLPARDYIRSNKVRVRRLNKTGLHDLMEFINQVAENDV